MKKNRGISFLTLSALMLLPACSQQQTASAARRSHEHRHFASSTAKEDCVLCGERADSTLTGYWGQDNVGVVCVNTFQVLPVNINTYDLAGEQIREAQGVFLSGGGTLGESIVHTFTNPDRGDSHVDIQYVGGMVDPEAIGGFLCQTCLDAFASHYFEDESPPEIAIVNFTTREIRPLLESCPWFTFDNCAVACDFQENGSVSLLIYSCPPRFQKGP